MRKRTVKNLCKEIFWHIVYFLPIVIALFSMLLFTTETYAQAIVSSDESGNTQRVDDLTDTTWTFNETLNFDMFDDLGFTYDIPYSINYDSAGSDFSIFGVASDLLANGGRQLYYQTNVNIAYDSTESVVWSIDSYRIIHITGGSDATNADLINFIVVNAVQNNVVDTSSISLFELVNDSFNSSFEVMGMTFENDILYNALNQVFVNGGILAVFTQYSILLKFACYYFYVHVIHLFIDALLFIPKLAHKWIDSLTRCE